MSMKKGFKVLFKDSSATGATTSAGKERQETSKNEAATTKATKTTKATFLETWGETKTLETNSQCHRDESSAHEEKEHTVSELSCALRTEVARADAVSTMIKELGAQLVTTLTCNDSSDSSGPTSTTAIKSNTKSIGSNSPSLPCTSEKMESECRNIMISHFFENLGSKKDQGHSDQVPDPIIPTGSSMGLHSVRRRTGQLIHDWVYMKGAKAGEVTPAMKDQNDPVAVKCKELEDEFCAKVVECCGSVVRKVEAVAASKKGEETVAPSHKVLVQMPGMPVPKELEPKKSSTVKPKGGAFSMAALAASIVKAAPTRSAEVIAKDQKKATVAEREVLKKTQGGIVTLYCTESDYAHEIRVEHFSKLQAMFRLQQEKMGGGGGGTDVQREEKEWTHYSSYLFHARLFLLMQRYFVLTGCNNIDAEADSGWHGSIPPAILSQLLGRGQHSEDSSSSSSPLRAECFASPFNTASPTFCSAFYDTDRWFGSLGSFFQQEELFAARGGLLEANPPFDHSVALDMGHAMLRMLTRNTELLSLGGKTTPLTFVVVFPGADGGRRLKSVAPLMDLLHSGSPSSSYITHEGLIPSKEAPYVSGYQQGCAQLGDGGQEAKLSKSAAAPVLSTFTVRLDTQLVVLQSAPSDAAQVAILKKVTNIFSHWKAIVFESDLADVGQEDDCVVTVDRSKRERDDE